MGTDTVAHQLPNLAVPYSENHVSVSDGGWGGKGHVFCTKALTSPLLTPVANSRLCEIKLAFIFFSF